MKITEQKVLKFVDAEKLIQKGDNVLVALSGGPDSVFLLYMLDKYKKRFGITLAACHLNHHLRGKESDKDEQFCKELCESLGINLHLIEINVKKSAEKNKKSIEEAARDLRYAELNNIAVENNYSKIATAHTMDDNAETVMLNLVKGTGLAGISGIPITRDNIIRPVLCLNKYEITGYLKKTDLQYRVDKSNLKDDYQRNFIRNRVLPVIKEKLNPALNEALFRSSRIFRDSRILLSSAVEKECRKFTQFKNNKLSIDLKILDKHPEFLLGEVLKLSLQKHFGHTFNFDDYSKLKDLISRQKGKHLSLSKKLKAIKERNELLIFMDEAPFTKSSVNVPLGKKINAGSKSILIERLENPVKAKISSSKFEELISGDGLTENFTVRIWKNGDKFRPLGMKNFKKVSDFLNEQHVPASEKKNHFVLLNRNNIVWVVGLRIDDRYKLTSKSKAVYKLWLTESKN